MSRNDVIVYDDRPTQELRSTVPAMEGPASHRHEDWTPLRTALAVALLTIIAGSFVSLFVLATFIKPHTVSPGIVFTAPPAELSTSPTWDQGMVPAPATYVVPPTPTTHKATPTRRTTPTPRPDPTRTTPQSIPDPTTSAPSALDTGTGGPTGTPDSTPDTKHS